MTNWIIREAIIEDGDGLQKCMESAYSPYKKRFNGKNLPPMDVDYTEEIKNYPTWVIDHNGKIIGGLIMVFEQGFASVANISIHPDFQGNSLGRKLLEFAESIAKNKNIKQMKLATHRLLTENIELYKYLGWKQYDHDENRVYMEKVIM